MPAKYRYTLNGTIISDEPLNWESLVIDFKRSEDIGGVVKTFSQDLSFWGDGYDIIKAEYVLAGISGEVVVVIELYDYDNYAYEVFFNGTVNFTNYSDVKTPEGLDVVETNLEANSFEQKIQNGFNLPINTAKLETRKGASITPFPTYENIRSQIDGQIINKVIITSYDSAANTASYYSAGSGLDVFQARYGFSLGLLNDTEATIPFTPPSTRITDNTLTGDDFSDFVTEYAGVVTFVFDLQFDIDIVLSSGTLDDVSVQTQWHIGGGNNFGSASADFFPSGSELHESVSNSVTHSVYLPKGSTVELDGQVKLNGLSQVFPIVYDIFSITVTKYDYSVVQNSVEPTSIIYGMFPFEAFTRMVNYITEEPDRVKGDIISRVNQHVFPSGADGAASRILCANGLNIRQFPLSTSPLVLKMNELLASLHYGFNIGAGVVTESGVQYLLIDDIETFYDESTVIMTITDSVRNSRRTSMTDEYWSTIKTGFTKYKIEDRNFQNTQEFNTQRTYNSGVTVLNKTKNLLSPYIGAGHGLEYQRRNKYFIPTDENEPDSSRFDDDIFLICTVFKPAGTAISEGNNPSVTNSTWYHIAFLSSLSVDGTTDNLSFDIGTNEFINDDGTLGMQFSAPAAEVTLAANYNYVGDFGSKVVTKGTEAEYMHTTTVIGVVQVFGSQDVDITFATITGEIIKTNLDTNAETISDSVIIVDAFTGTYPISLTLTDTITALSAGFSYHFRLHCVCKTPTIAGSEWIVRSNGFDFKMETNALEGYRQENATDYFGGGVTVNNVANGETSLNWRISPRQSIFRHTKTNNAVDWKVNQGDLIFTGDPIGNIEAGTTNPITSESDDVPTTGDKLYENELVSFEMDWGLAQTRQLDQNRYGIIVVNTPEMQATGFVQQVSHRVEEGIAEVTLRIVGT